MKPTKVDEYLENLVSLYIVLDRAWRSPFTVKSDFARDGALHVAIGLYFNKNRHRQLGPKVAHQRSRNGS